MHLSFNQSSLTAWLAMATIPGMTPQKWHRMLSAWSLSAEELMFSEQVFQRGDMPQPLISALATLRQHIDENAVQRALNWQQQNPQHHILTREHIHWPDGFSLLSSPPLVLFAVGNVSRLSDIQIAIVGSRQATHSGLHHAGEFSGALAQSGITVTSGLATGIDSAAHKAAMNCEGRTIAFFGTGIDIIYPRRNQSLAIHIVEAGGLLVSEFFPGTPARRFHFPRRNRLIASVATGTLVVEASLRSGTLITANLAANMGRDVFAVPGNIGNPQTSGCHALIQQGAKLVISAENIIEELGPVVSTAKVRPETSRQKSKEQNLATDKLLDSVELDVTGVDIIAERSALPVSVVMATLLEYELRGLVAAVPGGYVKLRGK